MPAANCWNCWTKVLSVKPVLCAYWESPIIFCVVFKIFLVGGSRICHPNCLAMEKSSRLNGSAMFACVGTRCSSVGFVVVVVCYAKSNVLQLDC